MRFQVIGIAVAISFLILPLLTHAQTSGSTTSSATLSAIIRAAILKDPRAAALPAAQLDAMVSALTSQAQAQGVTAQAIAYRPNAPVPNYTTPFKPGTCADISSPLCVLGQSLGFDNPNKEVPIGLWITSGLLIAVIWHMRRNPHLSASVPAQKPPSTGPLG